MISAFSEPLIILPPGVELRRADSAYKPGSSLDAVRRHIETKPRLFAPITAISASTAQEVLDFDDAMFEAFLKEKRFLDNLSPKTVQSYRNGWSAWKRYNGSFSPQGFKNFMMLMREVGLAPESCNSYAGGLNSFLTWLHKEGHTAVHLKIPLQRIPKRVLGTYSDDQVEKMLAFKPTFFSHRRMSVMVCLMADTGIRVSEARKLRRNEVEIDHRRFTVMGKGSRQRTLPLSKHVRQALGQWMQTHDHDLVFGGINGEEMRVDNLLPDLVSFLEAAEVEKAEGAFHAFRRYFAKTFHDGGGSVFHLQRLLGHAELTMTLRYTEIGIAQLQLAHEQFSPISRLKERHNKQSDKNPHSARLIKKPKNESKP